MADKALYILAGYDDTTEKRLSDIQNKLYEAGFTGRHTKNIPQHITLASFPTDKEARVISKLQSVSETAASFEVTFNHVGIFGGARVMFIAPDSNHKLLELQETFSDSRGWTPHTTMLIDEPDEIFRALPLVMDAFSSFSGSVTTLHLYEFFPTRHILSVQLMGRKC